MNCIDIEFLKKLNKDLETHQISHDIYLVCLDPRKEIEFKLRRNQAPHIIQAYGTDDMEATTPA
jgi:hypothetical protein